MIMFSNARGASAPDVVSVGEVETGNAGGANCCAGNPSAACCRSGRCCRRGRTRDGPRRHRRRMIVVKQVDCLPGCRPQEGDEPQKALHHGEAQHHVERQERQVGARLHLANQACAIGIRRALRNGILSTHTGINVSAPATSAPRCELGRAAARALRTAIGEYQGDYKERLTGGRGSA